MQFATSMENKFDKINLVYGPGVCCKFLSAHECLECITKVETQVKA